MVACFSGRYTRCMSNADPSPDLVRTYEWESIRLIERIRNDLDEVLSQRAEQHANDAGRESVIREDVLAAVPQALEIIGLMFGPTDARGRRGADAQGVEALEPAGAGCHE